MPSARTRPLAGSITSDKLYLPFEALSRQDRMDDRVSSAPRCGAIARKVARAAFSRCRGIRALNDVGQRHRRGSPRSWRHEARFRRS